MSAVVGVPDLSPAGATGFLDLGINKGYRTDVFAVVIWKVQLVGRGNKSGLSTDTQLIITGLLLLLILYL